MECSSFNVHHYDKHQQLYQYVQLLFNRFISHHFKTGAIEVHLIFDSPSVQAFNPKYHERTRRDTAHTPTSSHEHITFTPSTVIPNSWRPLIECRECKQSIMAALSLAYAQTISLKLQAHQKLIVGGNLRGVGNFRWCNIIISNKGDVQHKCRRSRHENMETYVSEQGK